MKYSLGNRPFLSVSVFAIQIVTLALVIFNVATLSAQQQSSVGPSTQLKTDMIREVAIKSGRAKAQGCTRCHGRLGLAKLAERDGWDGPIGGFITRELVSFRDGYRSHAVMSAVAAPLSDEDILQISLWFESLAKR